MIGLLLLAFVVAWMPHSTNEPDVFLLSDAISLLLLLSCFLFVLFLCSWLKGIIIRAVLSC